MIIPPQVAAPPIIQTHARARLVASVIEGGVVEVLGTGAWTPEYAAAHFGQLNAMLIRIRGTSGRATVLVDLSAAAAQSAEVVTVIGRSAGQIYRRGDRVALVVASSLIKAQMRKVSMQATRELFLSRRAALLWLQAA